MAPEGINLVLASICVVTLVIYLGCLVRVDDVGSPLRVKNHLEPVRKFSFSTAVPFFRLWLIEASRSIIKLPISFFEFSQSDDSESDEIIFDWILLKTTVKKRFEKTFMVSTIRALLNSSSRTLFRLFFLFYHTSTMTRPFFFLCQRVW